MRKYHILDSLLHPHHLQLGEVHTHLGETFFAAPHIFESRHLLMGHQSGPY